jgi:hypothetical protein
MHDQIRDLVQSGVHYIVSLVLLALDPQHITIIQYIYLYYNKIYHMFNIGK